MSSLEKDGKENGANDSAYDNSRAHSKYRDGEARQYGEYPVEPTGQLEYDAQEHEAGHSAGKDS